jgi:1,4-alpha-glucan branching enzyme
MHDTLQYLSNDPVHRRWHHDQLTFRSIYGFNENFVLPLSHDEVVHGKGSLIGKMPGDDWQKRAGLRLLFGWQWAQPGKKLLFMGGELGQYQEWNHDGSIDWDRHDHPDGAGIRAWVRDLNLLYQELPVLAAGDSDPRTLRWIVGDDNENSVFALVRHRPDDPGSEPVVIVVNATPVPRHNYRIGVPAGGRWREVLNSDAAVYGGSGVGNHGQIEATPVAGHGFYHSLNLSIPPLGALFLVPDEANSEASPNGG